MDEKKLSIDYTFYITHQLMKPLQQLFGLTLPEIYSALNKEKEHTRHRIELLKIENICSSEEYIKKEEKICLTKVKILLFDEILVQIQNINNCVFILKYKLY